MTNEEFYQMIITNLSSLDQEWFGSLNQEERNSFIFYCAGEIKKVMDSSSPMTAIEKEHVLLFGRFCAENLKDEEFLPMIKAISRETWMTKDQWSLSQMHSVGDWGMIFKFIRFRHYEENKEVTFSQIINDEKYNLEKLCERLSKISNDRLTAEQRHTLKMYQQTQRKAKENAEDLQSSLS